VCCRLQFQSSNVKLSIVCQFWFSTCIVVASCYCGDCWQFSAIDQYQLLIQQTTAAGWHFGWVILICRYIGFQFQASTAICFWKQRWVMMGQLHVLNCLCLLEMIGKYLVRKLWHCACAMFIPVTVVFKVFMSDLVLCNYCSVVPCAHCGLVLLCVSKSILGIFTHVSLC